MPCAMSSLRGASGVVWGDRVVCSLVLHAITITHLDVRLCTDLFFLLCALLLCVLCAPCLCCALFLACPVCGVSAWCCCCGVWVRCATALPCPVGACYSVPLYFLCFSCLNFRGNTCPYIGGYIRDLIRPYIYPVFRLDFMLSSVHIIKAGPWIPNVIPKSRLEFSMLYFLFVEFFPVKFPA